VSKVNVMLRFPEGHWIEKIPRGNRAKLLMEIINNNAEIISLRGIHQDIKEIKSMLLNNEINLKPTTMPKNNGDKELLKSILRMGEQQYHGNI